jgi:voltage-gated potassium channel Kch
MICGSIGFYDYHIKKLSGKDYTVIDAIYQTLQLFVLNFNIIPPDNKLLDIARLSALVSVLLGGLQSINLLANEGLQGIKLYFIKNHTVICGIGLTGNCLYSYLEGKKVNRFILIDIESLFYGKRSFNTVFIPGDAASEHVITQMKLNKAKYLYITIGDDFINVKILHEVLRLNEEHPLSLSVYIRIEDDKMKDFLHSSLDKSGYNKIDSEYFVRNGIKIKVDNVSSFAIKKINDNYKICSEKNIVVFGCGSMGKRIIYTTIGNVSLEDVKITVIEQSQMTIKYHKDILDQKYNIKKGGNTVAFHCQNALLLDRSNIQTIITDTPDLIFVCLGGNWANIKTGLLLREIYENKESTKIILISSDNASVNDENKLFLLENNHIDTYHLQQNAVEMMCLNNET